MSIATRKGDDGTTGLMYNRRVSKGHPRVQAYGSVDELNAALGLARAAASDAKAGEEILAIQKDLVILMGELATDPADLGRYVKDGFQLVAPSLTVKLDDIVKEIESKVSLGKLWSVPGANTAAGALDYARTVCRRAERQVCALKEGGGMDNMEIIVYLNRLSDALFLMARRAEK